MHLPSLTASTVFFIEVLILWNEARVIFLPPSVALVAISVPFGCFSILVFGYHESLSYSVSVIYSGLSQGF